MSLITWLIVGLIAGLLASAVMGGVGFGLLGDIAVGMAGAILGGWLFGALGIAVPFGGPLGIIVVAFSGSVVLLFLMRALRQRHRPA